MLALSNTSTHAVVIIEYERLVFPKNADFITTLYMNEAKVPINIYHSRASMRAYCWLNLPY